MLRQPTSHGVALTGSSRITKRRYWLHVHGLCSQRRRLSDLGRQRQYRGCAWMPA